MEGEFSTVTHIRWRFKKREFRSIGANEGDSLKFSWRAQVIAGQQKHVWYNSPSHPR
jgi:hypothetical protein